MKRKLRFISLFLMLCLILVSCTSKTDNQQNNSSQDQNNTPVVQQNVVVAGLKGPTSIGMIKLIDEKALNSEAYSVDYQVFDAPDALTAKIIKNEVQIAAVPTNLAAVLYNKSNGNVQFLAQNTLGVLYAVGKDTSVNSLADLEGKKVVISGTGSVPEYALNYLLAQNGLTDKVSLDYLPDHAAVAQTLLAGDADVAILPQPFVTQVSMKDENIKILIDLNKAWEEASNGESVLSMGCIVVNKEFASNNKAFIAEFLNQYEQSVKFVNDNPKDAGVLVEKNGIIANATLVEKAIPNCSIVFKNAQDAKSEINAFLEILFESDNKSVGGKLPDENFYYQE